MPEAESIAAGLSLFVWNGESIAVMAGSYSLLDLPSFPSPRQHVQAIKRRSCIPLIPQK